MILADLEATALLRRHRRKRKAKERYRMEHLCDTDFRTLCETPTDDSQESLEKFLVQHGGLYGVRTRVFRRSGREQTREAYAVIRGKRKIHGEFVGGPLGRLRVQAGEPLELRRINLDELPEIAYLECDVCAQFEQQKVGAAFDALAKRIDGGFWGVFERGRVNGKNHLHVFVKPGSCNLGVSKGIIPDAELVDEVRYLLKPPVWESDVPGELWYTNLLALYLVKLDNPGKRIATRANHRGLGNSRTRPTTFQQILGIFGDAILSEQDSVDRDGANLARQAVKADEQPVAHAQELAQKLEPKTWRNPSETWRIAVAPAPLPTIRHSSPETTAQVEQVHRAWLAGDFDGRPGRVGVGRAEDLGKALSFYFSRSWLSGGEADDLCRVEMLPQIIPIFTQNFGQAVAV